MKLRSGNMPEHGRPGSDPAGTASGDAGDGVRQWRVSRALTLCKGLGALAFAGAALAFSGDAIRLVIGGLAAVLLATYAIRDLLAPVRLEADADGVTVVTGFAGRRRIPWSAVDRVRVDRRRRLGTSAALLEIDADESLHLLGPYELGAPVVEVADELSRLRLRARGLS